MTFAEKLKSIRRQADMSQEQLAEKLGVSRQAVTKWETDTGIPDIENIMAISALFDISIDRLLSDEKGMKRTEEYLFESVMEYDSLYCPVMRAKKSVSALHPTRFPRSRKILRSGLTIPGKGLMWM